MNKFILIISITLLSACAQTRDVYVFEEMPRTESIKRNVYFYGEEKQESLEVVSDDKTIASSQRRIYMFEENNSDNKNRTSEKTEITKVVANTASRKVYLFDEKNESPYIKQNVKTELIAEHDLANKRSIYWFNDDGSISTSRQAIVDKSFVEEVELPEILTASNDETNTVYLSIDNLL